MSNKYIIYRKSDGYIENVIVWDGNSNWEHSNEYSIEKVNDNDYVGIGFIRKEKGIYNAPEVPITPMTIEKIVAELEKKLNTKINITN